MGSLKTLLLICFLSASAAAQSFIEGRVTDANGRGVYRAHITAWNSSTDETFATYTSLFGYYRLQVNGCGGFTYLVYADAKRYQFDPQLAFFLGDEDGVVEANFESY
jgi:hypothetical protein